MPANWSACSVTALSANRGQVKVPFFGQDAEFPDAPFRLAAMFRCPVVLMIGLYRGGNRYDLYFEQIVDGATRRPQRARDALFNLGNSVTSNASNIIAAWHPTTGLTFLIFGTAMTKLKCLLLLFAFVFPAYGAEPAWGLSELMIDLGRVKQAKGTFVEKKYLKLLSAPLESSGQLNYTAPYRLEKITLTPKPESMVVDQDLLTIEMRGRKRSLQIQDYPVLWAFVESIRGTLKGDLSALQQFYKVKLDGDAPGLAIELAADGKKDGGTNPIDCHWW